MLVESPLVEDDRIKGFQILLPRLARLLRVDTEPVFLNVYGAPESIPRNEFRQTM